MAGGAWPPWCTSKWFVIKIRNSRRFDSPDRDIVEIGELPLYNQDEDANPPAAWIAFRQKVRQADALLFVTPEYNRGIPAVVKNVIDWGSRPYGKNSWANKAGAIVGTSPGAIGTAVAQSQLRAILVGCGVRLLGQPEVYFQTKPGLIGDDFTVTDARTGEFLAGFIAKFAKHIQA